MMENAGVQPAPERAKEYVVVARRYRPQQFEELIGQEHVAGALTNAIETNRTGHAYLFTGARGVGKTSAARILAKALNCVTGPTTHPCGKCEVCLDVSSGHDVDVLEIDGASNRGIDEIRQLRQNVNIRPSRARFKIYIIDEVHMLTREAFNALLKTLEEPPEHVKFIFCTTEPNKIPITVLSRCQRFDFAGIQTDSIERRLEQIVESEGLEAESEALAILARRAGGSMRDSQSLLEQLLASTDKKLTAAGVHALLGTADDSRLVELAAAVVERNAAGALAALDAAIMAAIDVGQFLEQLLGVFRDMMAVKVGCGDEQLLSFAGAEVRAKVRQLAEGVSLETVLAMLQILDSTLARFRVTTQRRTLAEMAVVRLANLGDLQDLGDLLAQAAQGNEIRLSTGGVQASPAPPSAPSTAASNPAMSRPAEAASQPPQSAGAPQQAGQSSPSGGGSLSDEFAARKAQSDGPSAAKPSADRPPQAMSTVAETATAVAVMEPPAAAQITADNCNRLWQEAAESLGGLLASAAAAGNAAILAPNRLAITFPHAYNGAKALCEQAENLAKIKAALARLAESRMELQFDVQQSTETASPVEAEPKPISQHQKIFEVSDYPLVKQAEELFGASIRRVD